GAHSSSRFPYPPLFRSVLVQGDMRQPQDSFLENGSFRLVLAPFNVLMHLYTLDDQDAALAGAYALLEPGGLLALDLDVPDIGPRSEEHTSELQSRFDLV